MKILSLHCDFIKFKPLKKALKEPEELTKEQEKEREIKEPLVIFTAVEKQDEKSEDIVDKLIKEIIDISNQVGSKNIVLYPYAHLSSQLASPKFAQKTLEQAEAELKKQNFQVARAPFGYYKEFELKCKGHPLAELSREINYEGEIKNVEEKYDAKQLLREISKSKLDREKLKENDHRIIGQQMDLFSFSEIAP
ncbi:MAG: threonyl-tRNA synthetase editing domain-containing protein, partial [Nanoarchaeota archaeon]|nr:threonyl-tRNA synthetase editing domain-containing protein [Nanoarchaeota archaeon]